MREFNVEAPLRETPKAWLVVIEGTEVWVPKSRAELIEVDEDCFSLCVDDWLAQRILEEIEG
jgi:hypothetical protein